MSAVIILGVDVDMLADEEIIVLTAAAIGLECIVEAESLCPVDVLADMRAGSMIRDVPGVGVDVSASGLTAVMAGLEFVLPIPLEEPFHCS